VHPRFAQVHCGFALVRQHFALVRRGFAVVHPPSAHVRWICAPVQRDFAVVPARFAHVHCGIAPLQNSSAPVQRRSAHVHPDFAVVRGRRAHVHSAVHSPPAAGSPQPERGGAVPGTCVQRTETKGLGPGSGALVPLRFPEEFLGGRPLNAYGEAGRTAESREWRAFVRQVELTPCGTPRSRPAPAAARRSPPDSA